MFLPFFFSCIFFVCTSNHCVDIGILTESIDGIAKRAKELGAKIVVVHGETLNEPVTPGTNLAAVKSKYVDILGHPGLITREEAEIALKNDIYLEISAHNGHCLGNGHVANMAREVGNKLLVDTDTHSPDNLITFEKSYVCELYLASFLTNGSLYLSSVTLFFK